MSEPTELLPGTHESRSHESLALHLLDALEDGELLYGDWSFNREDADASSRAFAATYHAKLKKDTRHILRVKGEEIVHAQLLQTSEETGFITEGTIEEVSGVYVGIYPGVETAVFMGGERHRAAPRFILEQSDPSTTSDLEEVDYLTTSSVITVPCDKSRVSIQVPSLLRAEAIDCLASRYADERAELVAEGFEADISASLLIKDLYRLNLALAVPDRRPVKVSHELLQGIASACTTEEEASLLLSIVEGVFTDSYEVKVTGHAYRPDTGLMYRLIDFPGVVVGARIMLDAREIVLTIRPSSISEGDAVPLYFMSINIIDEIVI